MTNRLSLYLLVLFAPMLLWMPRQADGASPDGPAKEWRGVWVTRFEWTPGGRAEIQSRVREIMETLSAGRFNAILFQVRGQGDTLYPSPSEPWSPLLSGDARSIDPVAFAISEARKNGLEFHAWLNLSTVWQSAEKRLPGDRRHPFYRYADARRPQTSLGLVHDMKGRPLQWGADNYVWLTPGNPDVAAWTRRQVYFFLRRYPVDGLHWDDRTGNPHLPSRDPVSLRRFQGRGNPMRYSDLAEWQRDQLKRMLSDLYVLAKSERPGILISAAPFGLADKTRIPGYGEFKDAVHDFGSEPERWLRAGIIDVLMPQIYWDERNPKPNFSEVLRDWVSANRSGRPIWPGTNLRPNPGPQPLDGAQRAYLQLTRSMNCGGITFYSWSAAEPAEWRAAGKWLFRSRRAAVPTPQHIAHPQAGHVMGVLVDQKGRPVLDSWVRLEGRNYVYLSGSDGFFAIPNLPPGRHRLVFDTGTGNPFTKLVLIEPGKVSRVSVTSP